MYGGGIMKKWWKFTYQSDHSLISKNWLLFWKDKELFEYRIGLLGKYWNISFFGVLILYGKIK